MTTRKITSKKFQGYFDTFVCSSKPIDVQVNVRRYNTFMSVNQESTSIFRALKLHSGIWYRLYFSSAEDPQKKKGTSSILFNFSHFSLPNTVTKMHFMPLTNIPMPPEVCSTTLVSECHWYKNISGVLIIHAFVLFRLSKLFLCGFFRNVPSIDLWNKVAFNIPVMNLHVSFLQCWSCPGAQLFSLKWIPFVTYDFK